MTETVLSPAAQDVLDAFVPAPSLAGALDPTAEAKGRAIAAGVEVGPDHVVTEVFPSVWLVIGGTRKSASYVALVSTDERRAWDVARDAIRLTCGVRVERHPLI